MQLQLDPGIPTNLSPEEMRDFKTFIDTALDSLTAAAGGEIFTTGNAMLAGLAAIVVVLNGVKIAFSGNIQPWELVRVVIGLWIPWVMLQFYMTTIPGMAFTFPGMIAGGGNWLHDLLVGDAVYSMLSGLGDLGMSLLANIETQGQQGSILGVLSGGAHALKMALIGIVMMVFIFLMLLLLFAITYAQVIWAHIALAMLTILGPIFIPFLVFEPLSFLFWGWFRAMITYSLYGVIAGAILRVFSAVGLSFVTSISAATTNPGWQSELDWLLWVMAVVPLFIAGTLASLKCGELATMLVTGGGAAGSGLMGMATTGAVVASGGAGAVAKAGAGAIK